MVKDAAGKPRGYAFIEFEHERDMHSEYRVRFFRWISPRRLEKMLVISRLLCRRPPNVFAIRNQAVLDASPIFVHQIYVGGCTRLSYIRCCIGGFEYRVELLSSSLSGLITDSRIKMPGGLHTLNNHVGVLKRSSRSYEIFRRSGQSQL